MQTSDGDTFSDILEFKKLLLQDEEVIARNLAEQLLEEDDAAARVRDAYLRTLNRAPLADEIDGALSYISSAREKFADFGELGAWQSYCRILMASNEFIYVD